MTERCELCGRAFAVGRITPTWFPHKSVCERKACNAAVDDAVLSMAHARDVYGDIIRGMCRRRDKVQSCPVGYRTDAMAEMDKDGENQWFLNVVKREDL